MINRSITLNGHHFASSIVDMKYNPALYEGYCRRYKNKIEIYNPDMSPLAVINQYGVLLGFSKNEAGEKQYRILFNDDPLYVKLCKNIFSDLRNIALGIDEHYIDTRKDGGMFSAYPSHEYRFG